MSVCVLEEMIDHDSSTIFFCILEFEKTCSAIRSNKSG